MGFETLQTPLEDNQHNQPENVIDKKFTQKTFSLTPEEMENMSDDEIEALQQKLDNATMEIREKQEANEILQNLRNEKFIEKWGLEKFFQSRRNLLTNFSEKEKGIVKELRLFCARREPNMDEKEMEELKKTVFKKTQKLLGAA